MTRVLVSWFATNWAATAMHESSSGRCDAAGPSVMGLPFGVVVPGEDSAARALASTRADMAREVRQCEVVLPVFAGQAVLTISALRGWSGRRPGNDIDERVTGAVLKQCGLPLLVHRWQPPAAAGYGPTRHELPGHGRHGVIEEVRDRGFSAGRRLSHAMNSGGQASSGEGPLDAAVPHYCRTSTEL